MSLTIRYGETTEGGALVELQRLASIQWQSDRASLLAHPELIHLPTSQLEQHRVRVAEMTGRLAGFSVVIPTTAICSELDGLFVEPELWGRGVGRAPMADAVQLAAIKACA